MKLKSSRFARAVGIGGAAVAFYAAYLLHDGLRFGVTMQQATKPEQAEPTRLGMVPRPMGFIMGDEEALKRAQSIISNSSNMYAASVAVFDLISKNISQKAKYDVMGLFVKKYGPAAASRIGEECVRVGSTFTRPAEMKKSNPNLNSRVNALAYGLVRCGEAGLNAAIDAMQATSALREKENKVPLSYYIASLAVAGITGQRTVDPQKALKVHGRNQRPERADS